MKDKLKVILVLLNIGLLSSIANAQPNQTKGRYEGRADSLRKEHMAPGYKDTVKRAPTDNMPVKKTSDSSSMPKMEPDKNQRMPVKELSDTLK